MSGDVESALSEQKAINQALMQQMQMLSSKLDKLQGSGDTNNAAPVYGPNIPATSSYGQQANGYGQQASGYGQQANAYGQQTAGYGQQAGGYGQQTSGYGQSNGSSGGYGSMSNMMAAAQNWSGTGATSTTETHTSWNNPKDNQELGTYGQNDYTGGPSRRDRGRDRNSPYKKRRPRFEEGEWTCPECRNTNWARRERCNGLKGKCTVEKRPEYVFNPDADDSFNESPVKNNMNNMSANMMNMGAMMNNMLNSMGGMNNMMNNGGMNNMMNNGGMNSMMNNGGMNNMMNNGGMGNPMNSGGMNAMMNNGGMNQMAMMNMMNNMSAMNNMMNMNNMGGNNMNNMMGGGMGRGGEGRSGGGRKPNYLEQARINGDWRCPECNNLNWAKRDKCNKEECEVEKKSEYVLEPLTASEMAGLRGLPPSINMSAPVSIGNDRDRDPRTGQLGRRPRGPGLKISPSDWECPRCYNINFKYREVCNGTLKGETEPCKLKRPDFEKYNVPLVKEYTGPTTDWDCWRCGCLNFARKEECFKCKVSKEEAQDESLRDL